MEQWTEEDLALFRRLARLADLRRGGGPDKGASLVHALRPEEMGEHTDDKGDDT